MPCSSYSGNIYYLVSTQNFANAKTTQIFVVAIKLSANKKIFCNWYSSLIDQSELIVYCQNLNSKNDIKRLIIKTRFVLYFATVQRNFLISRKKNLDSRDKSPKGPVTRFCIIRLLECLYIIRLGRRKWIFFPCLFFKVYCSEIELLSFSSLGKEGPLRLHSNIMLNMAGLLAKNPPPPYYYCRRMECRKLVFMVEMETGDRKV